MADAGGGYGGYEYAYASQAVSPRQIASMTPEERRQLIENYKVSHTRGIIDILRIFTVAMAWFIA